MSRALSLCFTRYVSLAARQYHTFTMSAMSLNLPSNMPTLVVTNLMSTSG